jgi:hypothetical protein
VLLSLPVVIYEWFRAWRPRKRLLVVGGLLVVAALYTAWRRHVREPARAVDQGAGDTADREPDRR